MYLFASDRISHQCQVNELLEFHQRVQVGQLCDPVLSENQSAQVGNIRGKIRLDGRNPILRQEQRAQARLEWEIAELGYVVVGQVNRIVILQAQSEVAVTWGHACMALTRAAPMFSIAEIL